VSLDGPAAVAPLLGHLASTVHHALAEDERCWDGAPSAVVVAVPGGCTHAARRAVANAVTVAQAADVEAAAEAADGGPGGDWAAGARVALLSDGSAAALAYGFDRRAELAAEEAPAEETAASDRTRTSGARGSSSSGGGGRVVVFADVGHSKMEATVADLRSGGVRVLGRAWDGGVSGATVDALVLQLACRGLAAKHPAWASQLSPVAAGGASLLWDAAGLPTRGGARLLDACRRAKVRPPGAKISLHAVRFMS
jgi:molecular chaperone DnaK (HSP70)